MRRGEFGIVEEQLRQRGNPDKLAGADIPLLAQIMNIVDAYDAMTTDRPYRRAGMPAAAIEELRADVRRGWKNAGLVDAFIRLVLNQPGDRGDKSESGSRPTVGA